MMALQITLLLVNVALTASGNMLLKRGAISTSTIGRLGFTVSGIGIIGGMALLTIYSYSQLNLTAVQSVLGLTYIATPLLAAVVFQEKLAPRVWWSLLAIVLGIILISIGNSGLA